MTDAPFTRVTRTYVTGSDQRFTYTRLLRSKPDVGRTVEIRNDCTGTPGGCVELWIRDHMTQPGSTVPLWAEAHMTPAEAVDVGLALLEAVQHADASSGPPAWVFVDALGIGGAERLARLIDALTVTALDSTLLEVTRARRPRRWRRWLTLGMRG
jgi:hypothetical protein